MIEAAASAFFAVTADQIGKAGSSYSALPEASKDKVRICARAALAAALSANTVAPDMTEAEIDAGLDAILAKDDTEIMLDELRELFGADLDVDSRFTIAQVITAMERSFEQGKAHIEMVNRAAAEAARRTAEPTDYCGIVVMDDDAEWLIALADDLSVHGLGNERRLELRYIAERIASKPADGLLAEAADNLEYAAQMLDEAGNDVGGGFCQRQCDKFRASLPQAKGDAE
jgi:hypothetical protein